MSNTQKPQQNVSVNEKAEAIEKAEKALKIGVKVKTGIKGGPEGDSRNGGLMSSGKEWQE